MDPLQALKDILLSAQRIGQPAAIETIRSELAFIIENAMNLEDWFDNGGYKPELYVTIEGMN